MDQEKRVLLAFVLSIGMLMVWRIFFKPPAPPPKTTPAIPAAVSPAPSSQTAAPAPAPASVTLAVEQGTRPEEIVVEGDVYRVTLSTQGAIVKSWVLKKYRDANEQPLDVVDEAACRALGYPMSVTVLSADGTPDTALSARVNSALFVTQPSRTLFAAPDTLEFTYSDGALQVKKRLKFENGYEAHAEVSVSDSRGYRPVEVRWPGGFGDHSLSFKLRDAANRAVYGAPGNLTTVVQAKLKEDRAISGPLALAGLEDRFFVDIFLPDSPDDVTFRMDRRPWTPPDWKESEPPKPIEAALAGRDGKPLAFRLFVAPKDLDVLKAEKPPLDGLVDFGWFSFVAKPLFLALRFIYEHGVHNWGWSIVLLTVLLNAAMFPLKMKGIRSAQEMQRVAPIVKSIQDKYKQYKFNDPRKQKMNEEIMKLYSEHGINPLGGCWPMALQLPLLYGFYRLLDMAIELRHAPWMGWIRDLSAPDDFHLFGLPFPLLPIMMIVTMFLLQRMTPVATTDPSQKFMMTIMPLAFGFIFFSLPSGLNLYYLTANIVGIGQQMLINRLTPKTAPLPPPGKRPGPQPGGKPKPPARSVVGVNK